MKMNRKIIFLLKNTFKNDNFIKFSSKGVNLSIKYCYIVEKILKNKFFFFLNPYK